MLPVSVNGLGVREALYILLFGRIGVSDRARRLPRAPLPRGHLRGKFAWRPDVRAAAGTPADPRGTACRSGRAVTAVMSRRGTRITLWIIAAAVAVGAGYAVYTVRQQVAQERERALEIARRTHDAGLLVEQLRAAQQAYVAQGQGPDFWMARVTETPERWPRHSAPSSTT